MPVIFLLLFVYVFGGALSAGIGGGRADVPSTSTTWCPGILLMTVGGTRHGTAMAVTMDMTEGIIARFRTMAISRASVLTGHVVGSVLQTMIGTVAWSSVWPCWWASGPTPTRSGGSAAAGLLALRRASRSPGSRSAVGLASQDASRRPATCPMLLILLPFLGSAFVPTDSMPGWLRWFAEYQPFTPIIETLRGLLLGTPIGNSGVARRRLVRRPARWSATCGRGAVQPRPA